MGSKVLILVCVLALMGVEARAEEQEITLDKIVVTPYRYEEVLDKTAGSVTIVTPAEITNSNAEKVIDALRPVPGVAVRDLYGNGVAASVDMAGFGDQGQLNVLVLLDGRRVNEVDQSGVDWSQIPLNQVERIEVIRGGAGGVLYGDNASSGVINIITKKGSGQPKINLETLYGSYDLNGQSLTLDGAIEKKFSYWFNLGRQATNGYRNNSFDKASDFASKLGYSVNDVLSMRFDSGFHASTFGLPGALFQHHLNEFSRRYARYGADHVNNKDYYFVLGNSLAFSEIGSLNVDFSYRQKDTDAYFLTSGNPTRKNKIETYGLTPKYTLGNMIFSRDNKFIAGLDFYRVFYNSNQYLTSNDSTLKDATSINKTSASAYLQDEFNLFKQLALVGGYRQEYARYAFGYHDSDTVDFGHPYPDQDKKAKPRMKAFNAGAVYTYAEDSNAFFNIGKTFRFPEVDEFIFQDINFQQQLNTNLKPQSALNYQAGLRHKFNARLNANLSLFRMNVEDELYFNPSGGPFGFGQNENYDKTVHEGLESSLEAKLNDWINLYANYTFTKSYFDGGPYSKNDIPMVPHNKASVGLRFTLPNNITFNMTGRYVGERYFINDTANAFSRLNGYMVADTNLSWRYKDFTATFGINNIFDKLYSEYGVIGSDSSNGFVIDKAYYPSPGRNFSLKLDYAF